ncbi:malto-oligosyltrehalose synthase [Cupriavidus sp. AU9028]|uniref:malto-oligosyltrehalose synthase n=1 Tax=Cupriavidus sp. AU9028 TaxID=2871157 RepID=UPI001C953D3D|nr:malto-oligosyltrehalose synthase [Cupriavidus sp. AU9028]MBY4898612.1 malto-oligosyltrehalose synthase [Cupriavidus sp. AU9028]
MSSSSSGPDTLVPRATARLQLHRGFTFADATAQVDYLAALGASHLYLSPIFAATPGSTHGYDVTDFHRINPELGGEEGFRTLAERARAAGLGIVIDIVPNHMAANVTHNGWWRDVLARGPQSPYAGHFDIDWNSPDPLLQGKVLLPILGNPYWDMLHSGDLRIVIDGGTATLHYGQHVLPLSDESVAQQGVLAAGADAFQPDSEGGVQRLHALLEQQHYRLAWWRTAADELNWRRFFEVSELVAVRVEQPQVFDDVHAMVLRLAREGWIDGVRVDHVDGLADPGGYCKQLRRALDEAMAGRNARGWIVVEKILSEQETLRTSWGIDGTTGYDFMDEVAAVLHDGAGQAELDTLWRQTVGESQDYGELVRASRRRMLERHLVTEFEGACRRLHACARADTATRDLTLASFRRALAALLEPIEVYRTYLGEQDEAPENRREDKLIVEEAAARARRDVSPDDPATVDRIVAWLCADELASPQLRETRARVQQLMPPLAAKAGEDTMFYRYGRLLSRNEVGSHPSTLAMPPDRFHARMVARAHRWPHAMLATATHDHKRGEDNRIRLAVLSELAADWHAAVRGWESMAAPLLPDGAPDAVDRLMLYQTLVGVWPPTLPPEAVPGQPTSSGGGAVSADPAWREQTETLLERVRAWQTKSVREAKRHGHWTSVDEAYETAYAGFLQGLHDNGLLRAIATFAHSIAAAGALNSLAQTLLQLTAPGVPDRYQGAEGWDFSLVDPDNRRPVDYAALRGALASEDGWQAWLEDWRDGRIKVQLVRALLALRQAMPALFRDGGYRQLQGEGAAAQHVLAFERSLGDQRVVVVTARAAARMVDAQRPTIDARHWGDTRLCLSGGASAVPEPDQPWTEVLTGRTVTPGNGRILLADLMSPLPVAVLTPGTRPASS